MSQLNMTLYGPGSSKAVAFAVLMANKKDKTEEKSDTDIALEEATIKLEKAQLQLKSEKQKIEDLVNTMLPHFVVEQVKKCQVSGPS